MGNRVSTIVSRIPFKRKAIPVLGRIPVQGWVMTGVHSVSEKLSRDAKMAIERAMFAEKKKKKKRKKRK